MKHTIRIIALAFAVSIVAACSSTAPVKVVEKTGGGKTYVPHGK
jgi:hypothetical protein